MGLTSSSISRHCLLQNLMHRDQSFTHQNQVQPHRQCQSSCSISISIFFFHLQGPPILSSRVEHSTTHQPKALTRFALKYFHRTPSSTPSQTLRFSPSGSRHSRSPLTTCISSNEPSFPDTVSRAIFDQAVKSLSEDRAIFRRFLLAHNPGMFVLKRSRTSEVCLKLPVQPQSHLVENSRDSSR